MKTATIILLTIIGLVIFVIGGGAGVFYQTQKDAPQLEKMSATLNNLSSPIVPTMIASGKVIEINGRNLILSNLNNNITVKINNDAKIYFFSPVVEIIENSATKNSEITESVAPEDALFSDIKKGDNLSINMKMLADGTMIANSVTIFIYSDAK